MSFAKNETFPMDMQKVSRYAKAMAHPARIFILNELLLNGETTISNLTEKIPLSRTAISQHMEILRKLHFVTYYEDVPFIYYQPRLQQINTAIGAVTSIHGFHLKNFSKSLNQQ